MPLRIFFLLAGLHAGCLGCAPAESRPGLSTADTLPRRIQPNGNALPLQIGSLCGVTADSGLRYAGGQRFILKSVADAEQHFFLSANPQGEIQRLYWLQAEELLPGLGGAYDYTSDSSRTLDGLPMWVNLRDMNGPLSPGSDRTAMVSFLTQHGFHLPAMAPRLRLVYVPEPRREFMVVYLEAASLAGNQTSLEATLARAQHGLHFKPCG